MELCWNSGRAMIRQSILSFQNVCRKLQAEWDVKVQQRKHLLVICVCCIYYYFNNNKSFIFRTSCIFKNIFVHMSFYLILKQGCKSNSMSLKFRKFEWHVQRQRYQTRIQNFTWDFRLWSPRHCLPTLHLWACYPNFKWK